MRQVLPAPLGRAAGTPAAAGGGDAEAAGGGDTEGEVTFVGRTWGKSMEKIMENYRENHGKTMVTMVFIWEMMGKLG